MTQFSGIRHLLAAALLLAAPALASHAAAPVTLSAAASVTLSAPPVAAPAAPSVAAPAASVTLSPAEGSSPAWPAARGPFSWADRVMNSTTISRAGASLWQLRARTASLFTPTVSLPASSVTPDPASLIPGSNPESPSAPAASISPSAAASVTLSPAEGSSPSAPALPTSAPLDPSFFRWLLAERMHEDAAALLFTPGLFAPSDTLQYLRGLLAYEVHDFPTAENCFSAVPESSPYAPAAQLFLDTWRSDPEPDIKPKSPFIAGAMSAVIPGSGKIYAGDLSSGLSTLLIVGALGAMTAEAWAKLGIRDWRTIGLASVFGVFYIGNIYGSALSVSVIRNTYADAQKASLLFGIRLPLHGE